MVCVWVVCVWCGVGGSVGDGDSPLSLGPAK